MRKPHPILHHCIFVGSLALAPPAIAQVPNTLLHSIPAPPTGLQLGAHLGGSVAVDGDYTVVGAPCHDLGVTDAGVAKVFDSTSGVLLYVLPNPSPASQEYFGHSVAISGMRVVVGNAYDDTRGIDAGMVYVDDLGSGTPMLPAATLPNPDPSLGANFGYSVAISGARVVVGAKFDDTGATDAGTAYVYDLSSGTPMVPVATLNNPSLAEADYFGISVAISGTRVMVGAHGDDTGATDAGSAYVYDLNSATPTLPVATLNNPSPAQLDYFGYSLALSGSRAVVGAYWDDTGARDAGNVYVYDLSNSTPTVPVTILHNPGPAVDDRFGYSVAISGTTVAIGAPYDDTALVDKGSAYVFGPAPSPTDTDSDGLLDAWELTHWPTTAGHGPLDDFDHDSYPELLELAFGLNPTLSDVGGLPPVSNEDGYLTMTIAKHVGVTYEVQSAGTLLPARPDSFSPATTTVFIGTATRLKVRDTFLIGTSPARFMRVKVTAAP